MMCHTFRVLHRELLPSAQRACAEQDNSWHVRFGSEADIQYKKHDVRFTPKSGHSSAVRVGLNYQFH
jgi:hypothetical protein